MLTHKIVRRIELEHEPGAWIEARSPSVAIMAQAHEAPSVLIATLQACILAWSYEDPVTPENVAELDPETATAVWRALMTRPEDEGKNSSAVSIAPSTETDEPPTNG